MILLDGFVFPKRDVELPLFLAFVDSFAVAEFCLAFLIDMLCFWADDAAGMVYRNRQMRGRVLDI